MSVMCFFMVKLINSFTPNAPFLYPLKTSKNCMVFWCFQGVEKVCIGNNWVNIQFFLFFLRYRRSYMEPLFTAICSVFFPGRLGTFIFCRKLAKYFKKFPQLGSKGVDICKVIYILSPLLRENLLATVNFS